jgi:serine/threonine protein phosphatase PrpC
MSDEPRTGPHDGAQDDTQPIPIIMDDSERSYSSPLRVEATGLSHRGKVRPNNEDHYLVARTGRSMQALATSLPEGEIPGHFDEFGYVMMVADGMGGAVAGEIASRTAISTMVKLILDVPDWIMRVDEVTAAEITRRATDYYSRVNSTLLERMQADPKLHGMGTTMTVAYSVGTDLFIAHAGDSRAYVFREGKLRQLTRDHTHVQRLVDAGALTREQAASHHLRHVLHNALGGRGEPTVDVDVLRLRLDAGDRILLCTDGLTEVVDDAAIAEILREMKNTEDGCRKLIEQGLANGAPDNITVVAAQYSSGETDK